MAIKQIESAGMAEEDIAKLRIEVVGDDLSEEEKARLTQTVADQLQAQGQHVEPAHKPGPEGARGFPLDAILIGLGTTAFGVVLTEVIGFLKSWSKRPGARSCRISVQVGERTVAADYDPATMTAEQVEELAQRLRRVIEG